MDLGEPGLVLKELARDAVHLERPVVDLPIRLQVVVEPPFGQAAVHQLDAADLDDPVPQLRLEARRLRVENHLSHGRRPSMAERASESAFSLPSWPEWPLTPHPLDLMGRCGPLQPPPQVHVLHRLAVRGLPVPALPRRNPLRDPVLQVRRVGAEPDPARPAQRLQRFDRGGELHPVVRRVARPAERSFSRAPERSTAPQPPGPGFPRHAPSVKISIVSFIAGNPRRRPPRAPHRRAAASAPSADVSAASR